jgi:hypothetical protein
MGGLRMTNTFNSERPKHKPDTMVEPKVMCPLKANNSGYVDIQQVPLARCMSCPYNRGLTYLFAIRCQIIEDGVKK